MTDHNASSAGLRVKWRVPKGKWLTGDWFQPDGTHEEYEGVVQAYLSVDGVPKAVILLGQSLCVESLEDLEVVYDV